MAANINISSYGFIFLALSSSQLLVVSIKEKDYLMVVYAALDEAFVLGFTMGSDRQQLIEVNIARHHQNFWEEHWHHK